MGFWFTFVSMSFRLVGEVELEPRGFELVSRVMVARLDSLLAVVTEGSEGLAPALAWRFEPDTSDCVREEVRTAELSRRPVARLGCLFSRFSLLASLLFIPW